MTEYEQRVTIGELVECHPQIQWNAVSPDGTATCMTGETRKEVEKWLADLPKDSWAKNYHVEEWKIYRNYPHDLNAMQSAVCSQPTEFVTAFQKELEATASTLGCLICELKAADWALCFLTIKRAQLKLNA